MTSNGLEQQKTGCASRYLVYRHTRVGAWFTQKSIEAAAERLGPEGRCQTFQLDYPGGFTVVVVGNNADNLSYILRQGQETAVLDIGHWPPVKAHLAHRGWKVTSTQSHHFP